MALTVGNLFKESVKYNMKLLAGQAGLCRPVQWIHIIETNEGAQFLHGNEVVITECIAGNDEEKLQRFVGTIYRLHASALIINTGMFIKTVPDSVIAFCEEKQLPLFALPWEVPLVDVTREYCQMIIDNAAQEDTVAAIMKDLIFHVGVWDYSYLPYNVMGQICLPYSVLWMFLSLIIIFVDDGIRHFLFGEELPEYRLF